MIPDRRIYCPYCGQHLEIKAEGVALRDYCDNCERYFYDNSLPVVMSIVEKDRNLMLVKRKEEPNKGEWCLPMGFAESGETIEAAALRELTEETGIHGRITSLVDVVSGYSKMYGDLIFITFEVEAVGGKIAPGDDAEEATYFPLHKLPDLAFDSNTRAVMAYLNSKQDYWAIIDSFTNSEGISETIGKDYLSNKLLKLVERNAETIARKYMSDVRSNKSTRTYGQFDEKRVYERAIRLIGQFSKWLGGKYSDKDVRENYLNLGKMRKKEGFMLSEVQSALSLIRKHIWEFALSHQVWTKTIDIYMSLEMERRMVLFFDKAAFYITKGYEKD